MDDFKLKQMNASAAMFRRTLGGTPAGSGDDMYNDRIDNINIGEQNLIEIGKDEAGNPIMGNPLNAIVETTPPSKSETQGTLANAADFLNKVGESMFLDESGKTKSVTDIAGSVFDSTALGSAATQAAEAGNYLYNFATATPEQQRAMALPNLAKAGLKEQIHKLPNATELEHSQLYENFYYGANSAQHNAEVKRIADTIGVREEVFANDPELYKNASLMAERIERMKKSKKYQDKDGNINMQKIYDDIPGLSKVQKEKGTAAAALVLANLEGMQTIGNVYKNNTAGQFFGSVGAGLSKEIGSIRKIWNWMGPTYGARLPNAEERTALAEVDANMRAIPKYSYNTTAQTIGAMLGGFLENAHYMGSSIIPRAAIALATRGKGGTITQKAGDVLSVATMAAITAPLQYEELINSVDENGNQKYTPQQARAIAIAQAIPQAILEDYSLRQIGGAIFGKSAAPALRDIIKKSAGLEAMKAGVADYIKFKVRDAVKAGAISYGSEFAEEFEQGISDRVVENLAQIFINGEDADVQSIESILYGAAGDTIEAWNAIAGFGVAGLLLNPIANTRAVLNFRNHVRMATTDKMVQGMTANAHYGSVLSGVWENKKQIKELHDKAPDVEQTILDAHNKEAGIEYGFVNIKELRKTENGEKIVQDIAQRNNVSDEELAACLDGSGMLRVKTSTLMQMEVNETQQNSIKENVTTELGTFTPAQQKAFFEVLESQMKGMKDFSDKTYKEAVDSIIKARFPDAEQAKLAREIIEVNYDNPLAEFRRRLNSINTELWEEVEAYVPQLREALKENGIKLNKGETFKDIAVKIASGQADERFDIPALASTLGEIRTGLAPSSEKLTQLVDAREKLLALRDRFSQLKPGEIVATATLSAEGLKVYDALNSMMSASQNENVRAAARANALMMARMADNMAKAYRAARNVENYTAEDYMREFFRLDVNADYSEMPQAAQMFQVSPAEFERQKAEVRSRYENTDQWLKAPNGEDTNLTEDQWVTVRTDAFKNWFGDWENDPDNASKIVDKNGEPKPLYHGTKMAEFNEFNKGNIFMTDDKVVADWYAGTENVVDKRTLTTDTDIAKKPIDEVIKYVAENQGIEWAKVQDSDLVVAMRRDFEYGFKKRNVARAEEKIKAEKERTDLTDAERKILDIAEKNLKLIQKFANGKGTANDVKKSIQYNKQAFDVRDGVENISERFELRRYINSLGLSELSSNMYKEGEKWLRTDARFVHYTEEDIRDEAKRILRNNAERGVYPLFANIRNPLVLNANGAGWNGLHLEKISGNPKDVSVTTDRVADYAKENGYDGAIIQNVNDMSVVDYNPADDIVAFDSTQVKDATGRNVGFDPESNNIYLQSAYHGTDARFDRFNTDYMGNGEGNQAHGWGMYFAKDRKIAEDYRNMLTKDERNRRWEEFQDKKFSGKTIQQWYDYYERKLETLSPSSSEYTVTQNIYEFLENALLGTSPKEILSDAKADGGYSPKAIKWFESKIADKFSEEGIGQVFKVDVPENDVLLDEQKTFKEQPTKVKRAIKKLLKNYSVQYRYERVGDEYVVYDGQREIDRYLDEEDAIQSVTENNEALTDQFGNLSNIDNLEGGKIYKRLASALGSPKDASLKLNEYGVKGITYDGAQDGRCFVVFDDKAINILEKYYQQGRTAKGAISVNERGQRLIQLFTEGADQSTFIHEMAHMFLMDLQNIAGIDPNSKQAKDLKTIMTWAEYKPGQAEEYKGTASYGEFKKREEAIKTAEAKGDTAEAQRLKGVWAQERFARAFEEYLRTGEAPARGLKKAFRDFKKWLTEIYNDVTGAGVRATPEVEAIMARIVASEEEIETLEAANNIARKITESNVMPENATELIKQWQEEAKEEAKEKLLKELVKQYYQKNLKNINEKLDEIRKNTRAEFQQVPCFICEQLIKNGTSMEGALEITGFANEQEYKDALEKAGGSLNNAVNAVVKAARENMIKQMPSNDELYNMAEDAINSGDYNARLSMLEADILKELKDEYNSLPAKLRRAFEEIDKHFGEEMSKETWAAFKRSIYRLKYAERWGAQEYILIKEFEDAVNKLEEPDRAAVEKLRQRYEKLKEQTIRNKQWINGIAGATDGKMKAIKQMAAERLGRESVSVATNARYWHRQALSAAKRAWDGLRKVNKGEQIDYDNAVAAKEEQAVYDAMTAQAIKNKQQLNRWMNGMNGFLARAKRMADPKFKADPNMRYYYSHLMYVFGIRNSDGIPPTDLKPITDVLADLRASHQFEDEVPEWLISAANATEQGKDYQQLTMGQLQELKKFTDILYTLARNQNQLLTMDVSMDDVVADCTVDSLNNVDYKVGHQKIGEVRGAIGDYMNGLLKPEVILSLLGGEKGGFIKYIYRILFDAAEAEEKAREAEAVAIRALYKAFYSKESLRAMLNDTVMTTDENGKQVPLTIGDDSNITKENLICMALNMGNSTNRARLCVGLFGVTNEQQLAMAEAEVTRILQENLTENDWKFVQAMWNHIDSFADPVSKVLEKSLGVPLDRVKREPFTVVFPDGRTMRMEGGYYPIVKDSSKSTRQTEFDQLEEAKAVGGVSVFGTGMSATKNRADNLFVDNGPLKLTLDVAHNHITAQIHLIHARMAVRDVYKVINNKAIQGMIRQTCGEGTVQSLNEWVLSCWAPPVRTRSWYENVVAKVRSKTVGAIMAYRASTALLNAANVVYMAQEIGVKNALIAMAEFYKHPSRNKQMILDVSVFMRNRASNIDRDLNAQQDSVLNRHEGVLGKLGNAIDKATGGRSEDMRYMIDKYANWMIETTDMMVSLPLYKWQFEQTYSEEIAKGVPEEEARETANFEATRRVQKVFGSSREVDRSKVQREKNEMVKMLTPFFTFANTMFNAVWSKYYAGKFSGSERVPKVDATGKPVLDADGNQEYTTVKKDLRQRYARFVRAAFFNFVLGALVETWLRQIPNWLAGSGDDDDDEDRIGVGVLSVNKKQWGKNVIDSAAAGFPLINIATENIVSALEGRRSGGRGVGVIAGSIGRWTTVANDIVKIAQGKDSVDAIDFMRDVVRVTNIRTGMSDTITDAVFNTVRFIGDDYQLDNMDDLREYIAKTIFDRKLKKK